VDGAKKGGGLRLGRITEMTVEVTECVGSREMRVRDAVASELEEAFE
jgi:hypothetical protein